MPEHGVIFGDNYVNTGSGATVGAVGHAEHDSPGYAVGSRSLFNRQDVFVDAFHSSVVHGQH